MKNSAKNKSRAAFPLVEIAKTAVCVALLCVLSPLSIPLPIAVPFTPQVLAVILCALLLKPLYAVIAQALYTALGLLGLPVFSGYKSGLVSILSPTGGFIIGFIFASVLVSLLKGKKISLPRYIAVSIGAGIPCIYIPGIAGYLITTGADLLSAVATLTAFFLLLDIIKCVVAALAAVPINKALSKQPGGRS